MERVQALKGRLYRTARLYLAGDAAALDAVDEAVYKGLLSCRRLRRTEYFDTWMTRILINVCNDELRRLKRERTMDELPEAAAEVYDRLPLRDAVERLPQELRAVVALRYFAGYTLAETAEILGIPPGTVSTRQRRARCPPANAGHWRCCGWNCRRKKEVRYEPKRGIQHSAPGTGPDAARAGIHRHPGQGPGPGATRPAAG